MIGDTIFAVASPPGYGRRGILRISGPCARSVVDGVVDRPLPTGRASCERSVDVLGHPVEVFVLTMPGPRSFTGEDVVELHLPGSPLLLARVQDRLRGPARDATPGEFSRRAFEHGKLTLAQAEAVADLIHATNAEQVRFAVGMLAGGLSEAVAASRSAIQDGLALLEVGLDFDSEETGAVPVEQWLNLLRQALGLARRLARGVPASDPGGDVALIGAVNAGKSSLCNALAGTELLVSDVPGTTRDVLAVDVGGVMLLDAPGDLVGATGVDEDAVRLRDRVLGRAAAALLVVDARGGEVPVTDLPVLGVVRTKCDLVVGPPVALADGCGAGLEFAVSSVTGVGIEELRRFVVRARGRGHRSGAARFAESVGRAVEALERAVAAGEGGEAEEMVAVDVGVALAALDEVDGRSTAEDVLDRVFGGFCLGK